MRYLLIIMMGVSLFQGYALAETEEEEMARIQKEMNRRVFELNKPTLTTTPAQAPEVQRAPAVQKIPPKTQSAPVPTYRVAPAAKKFSQSTNSMVKGGIDTGIKVEDRPLRCAPFGVDDKWVVRVTTMSSLTRNSSANYTILITENDGETIKLTMEQASGSKHESELRMKGGMVYPVKDTMGNNMGGNRDIIYISDVPVCPIAKLGESIVGHGRINGQKMGEQSSTVTTINPNYIKVTVPAGTFNTVEVVNKVVPLKSPPYTITHYYADGISSVKEIFRFDSGLIQIHELVEYKY